MVLAKRRSIPSFTAAGATAAVHRIHQTGCRLSPHRLRMPSQREPAAGLVRHVASHPLCRSIRSQSVRNASAYASRSFIPPASNRPPPCGRPEESQRIPDAAAKRPDREPNPFFPPVGPPKIGGIQQQPVQEVVIAQRYDGELETTTACRGSMLMLDPAAGDKENVPSTQKRLQ